MARLALKAGEAGDGMGQRHLRCYARGHGGQWEAICLDLDIAISGRSLHEVRTLLNEAVRTYFEDVSKEAPDQRRRLLNRRAPLLTRLSIQAEFAIAGVLERNRERRRNRHYAFHCHA